MKMTQVKFEPTNSEFAPQILYQHNRVDGAMKLFDQPKTLTTQISPQSTEEEDKPIAGSLTITQDQVNNFIMAGGLL